MKKLVLAILMMASATVSFAQHEVGSINIQPKVSFNVSSFDKLENRFDNKYKSGFAAGVECEYRMTKTFALSVGAFYSQKGLDAKVKEDMILSNGTNIKGSKVSCSLDYIDVPILANFYVWKGLALKVGVQPAFKVREKYEMGSNEVKPKDDKVKAFDICVPLGISYDFGRLSVELRSSPGFIKLNSNKDYTNVCGQLMVGYKFSLK